MPRLMRHEPDAILKHSGKLLQSGVSLGGFGLAAAEPTRPYPLAGKGHQAVNVAESPTQLI